MQSIFKPFPPNRAVQLTGSGRSDFSSWFSLASRYLNLDLAMSSIQYSHNHCLTIISLFILLLLMCVMPLNVSRRSLIGSWTEWIFNVRSGRTPFVRAVPTKARKVSGDLPYVPSSVAATISTGVRISQIQGIQTRGTIDIGEHRPWEIWTCSQPVSASVRSISQPALCICSVL